jgi:8-oxo-dGTP pyrophosphatase MutT (NUDIX family)
MNRIHKAGIILIDPNKQVLITFSKKSKKYGFPKGSCESKDTSLFHTAAREFEEETGYKLLVEEPRLIYEIENNIYFIIHASNRMEDYIIQTHQCIPDSNEIEFIVWKPINDMLENQFLKNCNIGLKTYLIEMKKIEIDKKKYLQNIKQS